jgi:hypothetical protein
MGHAGPDRARSERPTARPESGHGVDQLPPVDYAGRSQARPSPSEALRLQRTIGNQRVQRLVQPVVVQRTPLSDDLAKSTAAKSPAEIFALVGQQKYKDGTLDPAELAALTGVLRTALPKPDDCWLALRLMSGQLGMSGGVTVADAPTLTKDIPPQPIVASFVQGRTDERALVIAGVHGSERQGIEVAQVLLGALQKRQPHYSVVVVPSLFPQHAGRAWGVEGKRQMGTQTNRNFPSLDARVGSYKGGQALDEAGKPLTAAPDDSGKSRPILAENVMLMELIDRFHPSRIVSIHGTWDISASGVFADPHFTSPAKEESIEVLAGLVAAWEKAIEELAELASVLPGLTGPAKKTLTDRFDEAKKTLTERFESADETRTKNDVDLALATAYAIASRAKGASSLEGRFAKKKDAKKRKSPSVTGNKLYAGAGKENATWREDLDRATGKPKPWRERADQKGISLGLYAPAKGISVFTVEPPANRALDFYDGKNAEPSGAKVSKADRESEIKAYADAVALVLLGPDTGKDALAAQRPVAKP